MSFFEGDNSTKDRFPGLWGWLGFAEHRVAPAEAFANEVYDFDKKDPETNLSETSEDPFDPGSRDLVEDLNDLIDDQALVEKVHSATLDLIRVLNSPRLLRRYDN